MNYEKEGVPHSIPHSEIRNPHSFYLPMALLVPLVRRPQIPAWIASTLTHLGLMLLLTLWIQQTPQGASDAPTREVGIVLKRSTPAGIQFEGEESEASSAAQSQTPQSPANAELDLETALPDLATHSTAADALPTLPSATSAIQPQAGGQQASSAMPSGGGSPGGAMGDLGGQARVQVFGVEGVGTKFVYVFDRSASMHGAPLAAAKQQLLKSLDSLEETHQFQILFFNTRLSILELEGRSRMAYANQHNKLLAERFVAGIHADLGTDRQQALLQALKMAPDVIFFLTDADDPMSPAELAEIFRRNRRYGATISTIEFGRGLAHQRDNFLVQLARQTGGGYVYVNTDVLRNNAPAQ